MLAKSLSSNNSLPHPHLSSNKLYLDIYCFITRPSSLVVVSFSITNILLLLPVCTFILYHGLQQWWQNRSTSSPSRMSHSDCLTYHMVIIDMIGVLGCAFQCCCIYNDQFNIFVVGYYLTSFVCFGEVYIHLLTCVERYLAVVHPVTYISLRNERGIRIRNICVGSVWLLSIVTTGLMFVDFYIVLNLCMLTFSLITILICSVYVLCVLIRPGPGEKGRERVDQSKRRAFYTILAILGVLVVRFAWSLVWAVVFVLGESLNCLLIVSDLWFNIPSSLVLPLLFLHRAGKFICCKKKECEG